MKTLNSLKTTLFFLFLVICSAACRHNNSRIAQFVDSDDNFIIPQDAMVTDQQGVTRKLSEVLVADSTFVVRIKSTHPDESKYTVLYRTRYFTDEYPPANDIIMLVDQLPLDIDSTSRAGQSLNIISSKIRVYKIEKRSLSADLENGQRSYVFFLNKQLQAENVHMPEINSMWYGKTVNYFLIAADYLHRKSVDPVIAQKRRMNPSETSTGISLFNDKSVKVGDRTVGNIYYEDFTFRNKGDEPMEILNINNNWKNRRYCYVYLPEKPIKPGARARIRIYYRPAFTGWFRNKITLHTSRGGDPLTFTIKGTGVKTPNIKGVSSSETWGASKLIGFTSYIRY